MDTAYRDKDGYLRDEVLRVLGRSGAGIEEAGTPTYGRLREGNFQEEESDTESIVSSETDDAEAEWEDAKRMIQAALVGTVVPLVFRHVGRRVLMAAWTRILGTYFASK
ncbi:hypothetical protein GGF46_003906 [Coemansia sp. RSA 552]|nr:hypothetical protein GGF46_003906 [Coemansia sp. RSA 552]